MQPSKEQASTSMAPGIFQETVRSQRSWLKLVLLCLPFSSLASSQLGLLSRNPLASRKATVTKRQELQHEQNRAVAQMGRFSKCPSDYTHLCLGEHHQCQRWLQPSCGRARMPLRKGRIICKYNLRHVPH